MNPISPTRHGAKACVDLRQAGLLKVKAGLTSLEEVEAVTNDLREHFHGNSWQKQ